MKKVISTKKNLVTVPRYIRKNVMATMSETIDWSLKILSVPELWTVTRGEGIKVCLLDTGVDHNHPDLKDNIKDIVDFTGSLFGTYDTYGHGTHCAGIVAAQSNNSGIIGVAPMVELYVAKVIGDDGVGTVESVVDGIDWAIKERVDIISMSIGTYEQDDSFYAAIRRAYDAGIILIAASGNEGINYMSYPGKYDECISVGSVNTQLFRSNFSGGGSGLDIVAPGENIYSTYPGGTYALLEGTSMAAPFVAGVCSLILSKHRTMGGATPINNCRDMLEHLQKNARDIGERGFDFACGWGLIDPKASFDLGCLENIYSTERNCNKGHSESLIIAKEKCLSMIADKEKNISDFDLQKFVMGQASCFERVYNSERKRGIGHNEAMNRAKDVFAISKEVLFANLV
jgi:subtilisin